MKLLPDERELLQAELEAAATQLPEGPARESYGRLAVEVADGEVSEGGAVTLERFLEVGLETGRIRQLHGAHAEMAATRLFQRTPRGAALRETLAAANEALRALEGATLHGLALALRGPASYTLTLNTDRCQATLLLDRAGARLQSLEVQG